MSRTPKADNPTLEVRYVINSPKKVVYQSWIQDFWIENKPFPIAPSSFGSTSDNVGSSLKHNQRKLILSSITETITKLKVNNYICYKVESFLFPANNYIASVKFTNYHGNNDKTLITWSSEWECGCGCSSALCSPGVVVFSKTLEQIYMYILKGLDDVIAKKS